MYLRFVIVGALGVLTACEPVRDYSEVVCWEEPLDPSLGWGGKYATPVKTVCVPITAGYPVPPYARNVKFKDRDPAPSRPSAPAQSPPAASESMDGAVGGGDGGFSSPSANIDITERGVDVSVDRGNTTSGVSARAGMGGGAISGGEGVAVSAGKGATAFDDSVGSISVDAGALRQGGG